MKTKQPKWWSGLISLALLGFVTSCTSENDLLPDKQDKEIQNHITFNISVPGDNSVTYEGAATRAISQGNESVINSLTLYIFEYSGTGDASSYSSYTYPGESYSMMSGLKVNTTGQNITNDIPLNNLEGKTVAFFIIANHSCSFTKGVTMQQALVSTAMKTVADGKTANEWLETGNTLSMYYCSMKDYPNGFVVDNNKNATVSAVLKRHVARLDIANLTPGLVINYAYLKNFCGSIFGVQDMASGTVTADTHLYMLNNSALKSFSSKVTGRADVDAKKAESTATYFYMAPYTKNNTNYTTAVIEYTITLSGDTKIGRMEVPFADKSNNAIDILANNRYIIEIGDGTPIANANAIPDASIKVNDWDSSDKNKTSLEGVFNTSKDKQKQ